MTEIVNCFFITSFGFISQCPRSGRKVRHCLHSGYVNWIMRVIYSLNDLSYAVSGWLVRLFFAFAAECSRLSEPNCNACASLAVSVLGGTVTVGQECLVFSNLGELSLNDSICAAILGLSRLRTLILNPSALLSLYCPLFSFNFSFLVPLQFLLSPMALSLLLLETTSRRCNLLSRSATQEIYAPFDRKL